MTRSGMFCAMATVIDRCKTEGIVDVFQVVKALRTTKPGAILTIVSVTESKVRIMTPLSKVSPCFRNSQTIVSGILTLIFGGRGSCLSRPFGSSDAGDYQPHLKLPKVPN